MIKLFCSDFDNTLARRGRVPGANVEAIRRFVREGGHFAIVTGRVASNIRFKALKYNVPAHLVASNGALVLLDGEEPVYEEAISSETVLSIIEDCYRTGWYYMIFDRDRVYIPSERYKLITGTPLSRLVSHFAHMRVTPVDRHMEAYRSGAFKALKINIYPRKEDLEELRKDYLNRSGIYVTWSNSSKLEIMAAGVNKWQGIRELATRLSIKDDEIACIGDYNNDIPMLKAARLSFTVANGHDEVKAIVDRTVAEAARCGVAEALEHVRRFNEEGVN